MARGGNRGFPDRRLIDSTPETDCPYRSRYIRWRCRLRARKRSDLRRFGGALQAALALHTTHRGDHGRQPFRGAGGAQSVPGARRHSLRPASLRVPPTPVQVLRRASFSSPRDVTPERLPGADSPAPPPRLSRVFLLLASLFSAPLACLGLSYLVWSLPSKVSKLCAVSINATRNCG